MYTKKKIDANKNESSVLYTMSFTVLCIKQKKHTICDIYIS